MEENFKKIAKTKLNKDNVLEATAISPKIQNLTAAKIKILSHYSQTPLNTDTSLLRTVCFIPGEKKPLYFLEIPTA